MIIQDFVVDRKIRFDDDILVCKNLIFTKELGADSHFIIVPKKGANDGAPRILKIIADLIDTGTDGDSMITYDLDNDSLPDPDTKAKNGDPGDPDFDPDSTHLPPVASPNYIENGPNWIGNYPIAEDGGDGIPGGNGESGPNGRDGPILEIWANRIVGNGLIIDLRGQEGGNGGQGGKGQDGGNGQKGSKAVQQVESSWGLGYIVCKQKPGMGGDGGNGGDAGCGGDGGNGGNGGIVKIFYTQSATGGLNLLKFSLKGGKGGMYGQQGMPGKGGEQGPPGDVGATTVSYPCPEALQSKPGQAGMGCVPIGDIPRVKQGNNGADGYHRANLVEQLPEFPGLSP